MKTSMSLRGSFLRTALFALPLVILPFTAGAASLSINDNTPSAGQATICDGGDSSADLIVDSVDWGSGGCAQVVSNGATFSETWIDLGAVTPSSGTLFFSADGGSTAYSEVQYTYSTSGGTGQISGILLTSFADDTIADLTSANPGSTVIDGFSTSFDNAYITAGYSSPSTPEPSTLLLAGCGIIGVITRFRKRSA